MTIETLIKKLRATKKKYGNLEIAIAGADSGGYDWTYQADVGIDHVRNIIYIQGVEP